LAEKRRKEDVEKNNEVEDSDGKRKTSREEYIMKKRSTEDILDEIVRKSRLRSFTNKIQD